MPNYEEGMGTTHVAGDDTTHEPGQEPGKSGTSKTLDYSELADKDVNTPQQRDQSWTPEEPTGPRAEEPLRQEAKPVEPLPQPAQDKLEEVKANPHSDAQDTTDTQGEPGPLGGMEKTGSGDQDPMRNAQGSGSE
ncbi:MAG TPA: hypothetical protein VGV63_09650 [Acidimicrobiales bacterium]|nr:hypothetical protein [Acidimicrobiales bacterium]